MKILKRTISTLAYCITCIYSILYCSYCSIRPIYLFINDEARDFRDAFLEDEAIFGFIPFLLIGLIAVITLAVIYRHQKIASLPLVTSIIPILSVFFTLRYYSDFIVYGDLKHIRYLYWLLIIWFAGTMIYSIYLLIKGSHFIDKWFASIYESDNDKTKLLPIATEQIINNKQSALLTSQFARCIFVFL